MVAQQYEGAMNTMTSLYFNDKPQYAANSHRSTLETATMEDQFRAEILDMLKGYEDKLANKTSPGKFFFSDNTPHLADFLVWDLFMNPKPGLKSLGFDGLIEGFDNVKALVDAVQNHGNLHPLEFNFIY